MIFEEKTEGSNAVSEAAVRDMFTAYQVMKSVTVTKDGRTYSWDDGICWRAASGAVPTRCSVGRSNGCDASFVETVSGRAKLLQPFSAPLAWQHVHTFPAYAV